MLINQISTVQKSLIESFVCCEEIDYVTEHYRDIFNAIFSLECFLIRCNGGGKYDWYIGQVMTNIAVIKKICQFVVDKKIDMNEALFSSTSRSLSQLQQKYGQAISDTKKYLEDEGLLESLNGDWAAIVYEL